MRRDHNNNRGAYGQVVEEIERMPNTEYDKEQGKRKTFVWRVGCESIESHMLVFMDIADCKQHSSAARGCKMGWDGDLEVS